MYIYEESGIIAPWLHCSANPSRSNHTLHVRSERRNRDATHSFTMVTEVIIQVSTVRCGEKASFSHFWTGLTLQTRRFPPGFCTRNVFCDLRPRVPPWVQLWYLKKLTPAAPDIRCNVSGVKLKLKFAFECLCRGILNLEQGNILQAVEWAVSVCWLVIPVQYEDGAAEGELSEI